jgi:hypothetical protein
MTPSIRRTLKRAGPALALALLAACGSSSGGSAKMSVHLVDGPALEYSEIWLHVVRVDIAKDGGGWTTLGTPDVTVNLLTLTGAVAETLVDGAIIPAGSYGQMRLVLGSGNTIRTADGLHDLKVPSGMQSGVKLNVHFDVLPNTTKDVFIDFDAHRSIFVHQAGNSTQYILRPVVRAFDQVTTGAVIGKLTDAATTAPLPGVEVMAETLGEDGKPAVARTTTTAADGSYVLNLLPVGGSYWVVAQPRVGTAAYAAGAAGSFAVTAAAPVVSTDVAFTRLDATGAIDGTIAPPLTADAFDEVSLLGTVSVASVPHTFVLRSAPGTVSSGTESYAIDLLPAGTYSLFVTRGTPDGAGGVSYAPGPAASATVTAGETFHLDLAAP